LSNVLEYWRPQIQEAHAALPCDARHEYVDKLRILAMDRHAAIAANNLAWLYAENGGNITRPPTSRGWRNLRRLISRRSTTRLAGSITRRISSSRLPLFQQSLEKDPDNALTHYHLVMAYAKMGEDSKAISELKRALSEAEHGRRSAPHAEGTAGLG